MYLCCNAALPGIPPWNAQIGPHRTGPRLQNKTTFLRQVLTQKNAPLPYILYAAQHAEPRVTICLIPVYLDFYRGKEAACYLSLIDRKHGGGQLLQQMWT